MLLIAIHILLHIIFIYVFYTRDNSYGRANLSSLSKKSYENNSNKEPKEILGNKRPILPPTYIKLYENAKLSKSNIIKDFKEKTIIYMWFNKITGKVYIGSAVDGAKRLSTYYQSSVLKKNSLIYNNIFKYTHNNFSVIILEICGKTHTVTKDFYLEREQFFIDWALKTYGLNVLNILRIAGSSLDYRHTKDNLLKMSRSKLGDKNPMFGKTKSVEFILQGTKDKTGSNNPQYGRVKTDTFLSKTRKMIYVYDVTSNYKLLGVYPTVLCTRTFNIGYALLMKRLNDGLFYKDKYFFSKEPYNG